jgi:hypothetical protein
MSGDRAIPSPFAVRRSAPALQVLDVFVVGAGVWTLYCHALYAAAADFRSLRSLSFLPVLVSALLIGGLARTGARNQVVSPARPSRVPAAIIGAAVVLTVLYALRIDYVLFWSGVVLLALACIAYRRSASASDPTSNDGACSSAGGLARGERSYRAAVVGLALLAALVTLVAHRPDADDAFYVSIPVSALDHPDRPLLRFDGTFGEEGWPILMPHYRLHSYELLVAIASSVTRFPVPLLYYVLFPAVSAMLVIVANWMALREISGAEQRAVLLGLILTFVVLLTWGDVHRSFGNFAFVRLFQGKAVLVSLCVPATVYYAARFCRDRDLRSWLLFTLCQVGAIGIAATAIGVIPLLSWSVLLGSWRPDRGSTRTTVLGLLSSAYPLAQAVLIGGPALFASPALAHADVAPAGLAQITAVSSVGMWRYAAITIVLGEGWRSWIAILSLLAAPLLPLPRDRQRVLAGFLLVVTLVVLNPWFGANLWEVSPSLLWRLYWAIPFPFLIGLLGIGLYTWGPRVRARSSGPALVLALAALFVCAPEQWTLSKTNFTELRLPGYKVPREYAVATLASASAGRGGLVLAPEEVSLWVPTLRDHPRLIWVRFSQALVLSRVVSQAEVALRSDLARLVSGRVNDPGEMDRLGQEIIRRRVTTIVTAALPDDSALPSWLAQHGYESQALDRYAVWTRRQSAD